MTANIDPKKIALLLTLSASQLDKHTLSALSSARENALKRQATRAPVYSHNTGHEMGSPASLNIQQWMPAVLLLAALIAGISFLHHIQEQQITELDVAILTDDMPIEVFVD